MNEQIVELPVIWDAMMLCDRHPNGTIVSFSLVLTQYSFDERVYMTKRDTRVLIASYFINK